MKRVNKTVKDRPSNQRLKQALTSAKYRLLFGNNLLYLFCFGFYRVWVAILAVYRAHDVREARYVGAEKPSFKDTFF